jgi:hypothetical protein
MHVNLIAFSRFLAENIVRVLQKGQQVNTAEETHKHGVWQKGKQVVHIAHSVEQRYMSRMPIPKHHYIYVCMKLCY